MNFTSPFTRFKEPGSLQATSFEVFLTNPNCSSIAAVGAVVWNNVANPASWTSEGECYINGNRTASYDLVNAAPSAKFSNLVVDSAVWVTTGNDDALIPYHFAKILDEEYIGVYVGGRTSHTVKNLIKAGDLPMMSIPATSVYLETE